jgi:hypothetical protein
MPPGTARSRSTRPTLGRNLQRAVDAAAEGVTSTVTHLVHTHPTPTTLARPRFERFELSPQAVGNQLNVQVKPDEMPLLDSITAC